MLRPLIRPFLAMAILLAPPALAQSLKPSQMLSSLTVTPVSIPSPVQGADNHTHLAYELLVTNTSGLFITLDRVEVLGGGGQTRALASYEGDALGKAMVDFARKGRVLPPGVAAMLVLDVALPAGTPVPEQLVARISATRQAVGPDGKPVPMDPDGPFPARYSFTTAPEPVGTTQALVVEPPLRGTNWVAAGGCCATITPHRGTALAVNGKLYVPQRFAIDWVQLDSKHHALTGDPSKLTSYPCFGAPVYSATYGKVVNLYDGLPEQVPGHPKNIKPETIGGNMIVVEIDAGHYAFYGHLQPGSLKVKLGSVVKPGQLLGLVGNTGNSTAPHLHFELMDTDSPLAADGLPFVFTQFSSPGTLVEDPDSVEDPDKVLTIDPSRGAGQRTRQLPLNNQVVDFSG